MSKSKHLIGLQMGNLSVQTLTFALGPVIGVILKRRPHLADHRKERELVAIPASAGSQRRI